MSRDGRERAMRARWARRRRREIVYGRWQPYVDPTPTRDHINSLRRYGLSLESIAIMAGEHPSALSSLMQPSNADYRTKIRPEREAAYLAVRFDLDVIPDAHFVSGAGTARRLNGLMRLGWSQRELAARLGVTPQALTQYRSRTRLSVGTARRVRDLFEQLCMRDGPSRKAAGWAISRGFVSHLAWDDIDDPTETPSLGESVDVDEVAVERLMAGDRVAATREEQAEAVRRLAVAGMPDSDIAERLRVSYKTVERRRRELGIESRWVA